MKNSQNIEDLFKKALEGQQMPFESFEWDRLEEELDKKLPVSGSNNFTKWGVIGGVAAAVVGGILISNYVADDSTDNLETVSQKVVNIDSEVLENTNHVNKEETYSENLNQGSADNQVFNEYSNTTENQDDPQENDNGSESGTVSVVDNMNDKVQDNAPKSVQVERNKTVENDLSNNDEGKGENVVEEKSQIRSIVLDKSVESVCLGEKINLSVSNFKDYDKIHWYAGRQELASSEKLNYLPENQGIVEFRVIAEKKGLQTETTAFVEVKSNFKPEITWEQMNPVLPEISLNHSTIGFVKAIWYVDGKKAVETTENSVKHNFSEKGSHSVRLEVIYANGCKAVQEKNIHIIEDFSLLAPNAFNPESSVAENQYFMPKALELINDEFVMNIYDRNGQMVYQTQFFNEPWDGTYFNSGKPAPGGSYVWTVKLKGSQHTYQGVISLLR